MLVGSCRTPTKTMNGDAAQAVYLDAAAYIDENIEFVGWVQREDGLALPLSVALTKVGSFPGFQSKSKCNPRALLELTPPEVFRATHADPPDPSRFGLAR